MIGDPLWASVPNARFFQNRKINNNTGVTTADNTNMNTPQLSINAKVAQVPAKPGGNPVSRQPYGTP